MPFLFYLPVLAALVEPAQEGFLLFQRDHLSQLWKLCLSLSPPDPNSRILCQKMEREKLNSPLDKNMDVEVVCSRMFSRMSAK